MYKRFLISGSRPLAARLGAGAGRRQQRRGYRAQAQASSSSGEAGNVAQRAVGNLSKWLLVGPLAGVLGGGAAFALSRQEAGLETVSHEHYEASKRSHPWVKAICDEPGTQLVLTAEKLMEADHPFLEDDHMFSAFVGKGIVDDLHGFYSPDTRTFKTIISLGREVCGFPRVVHGGLTAAIIDESFGGLLFALKQQKALRFWGPAYTVSLEVQYKSKIAAGSTVLCTTEVESMEGRKLWMKATVSDGPGGKVFATARALFVAPKPQKLAKDVAQYLWRRVFPLD